MERPEFIHETQYGYTRDVYMLPVGTTFGVNNGGWDGEIIEIDGEKHLQIEGGRSFPLKEDKHYGMCLYNVKQKEVEIKTPFTQAQHTERINKQIVELLENYQKENHVDLDMDTNYSYGSIAIRVKGGGKNE